MIAYRQNILPYLSAKLNCQDTQHVGNVYHPTIALKFTLSRQNSFETLRCIFPSYSIYFHVMIVD